jgi:hypothetical protein
MSEPPCGSIKVPCSRSSYDAHFRFLKAILNAQVIISFNRNDGTNIYAEFYRWAELVEDGRWDWTAGQADHDEKASSAMPPNDILKHPCSPEIYDESIPLLEALLKARAIESFTYDDEDGKICIDYYRWADLAAWGPWDHMRDQMAQLFPETALESEAGRRYLQSLQDPPHDDTKQTPAQ